MEDDAQKEKPRKKTKKNLEGTEGESSNTAGKKRGVSRSKSSGAALNKSSRGIKGTRKINRSKSDDGESDELQKMSKATESQSVDDSTKRSKSTRKLKKSTSSSSKSPNPSKSPRRTAKSPTTTRKAASPMNSISPKARRAERNHKSPNEGSHRPVATRRSSLTHFKSWWDLTTHKQADQQRDTSPPPPPPPLPNCPGSAHTTRSTQKRFDPDVACSPLSRSVKSAVITRRKMSGLFHHEEPNILELSKMSSLYGRDDEEEEDDSLPSPTSRSTRSTFLRKGRKSHDSDDKISLLEDTETKSSRKSMKKRMSLTFGHYGTLLDSPSTASLSSTISGGDLLDNFLGSLFDIARPMYDEPPDITTRTMASTISEDIVSTDDDESKHFIFNHDNDPDSDSDSDNDTAASSLGPQEIKWIEMAQDNPADIIIKSIHDSTDDNAAIQNFIVPAGTGLWHTLADDFASTPFKSFLDGTAGKKKATKTTKTTKTKTKKKKKTSTKNPSLGETIGRDRKSVQAPDDRTLGTAGTEETQKATNHNPDLKTASSDDDSEDDDKLEGVSSHSRSSMKSSKSGVRRGGRKKTTKDAMTSSSHEPKRSVKRSVSHRQPSTPTSTRKAPGRSRSGAALRRTTSHHVNNKSSDDSSSRKPLRRTASHHVNKSSDDSSSRKPPRRTASQHVNKTTKSSETIDEFMAMTKGPTASPNKETAGDGTMSTATESTMTTAETATMRHHRRGSVGAGTINPTLIENFQLTF